MKPLLVCVLTVAALAQPQSYRRTYVPMSVAAVTEICWLAPGIATLTLAGVVIATTVTVPGTESDYCAMFTYAPSGGGMFEVRVVPGVPPSPPTQLTIKIGAPR
jgi:hypothetical protein